jgi:hypothetical protein
MQIPFLLAHGALGWSDEATVLVVGIAIAAYAMIVYLGDHKAKASDDKEPLEDSDSQLLD